MTSRLLRAVTLALALAAALATGARAQSYARFDVPDSLLADALRASGRAFEPAWNTLLIAELRARLAHQPSAGELALLEARIAAGESNALGSTIARDALELRKRWDGGAMRLRIAAWEAESLGIDAHDAGQFASADGLYRQALDRYRRLSEQRRSAWLLGSLGLNAFDAGEFVRADSLYREALAARRALGDQRMIGATLNSIGSTRAQLHRPAEAYGYLVAALEIRQRLGDERGQGATLNTLAAVQGALGRRDSARATYRQALAHATAAADSGNVLDIAGNLAGLCLDDGDAAAGVAYAMRGLSIAEQAGDASGIALLEQHLGLACIQQGRFAEAGEHFDRSLECSLGIGDVRGELTARVLQGRLGVELQDSRGARPPLERAISLADSLGDRLESSHALINLSSVCRLEGDSTRARSLATRAVESAVAAGDSASVHAAAVTLGQIAIDRGDPSGAAAWFTRAQAALDHPALELAIADQINLGVSSASLGRLDEANERFQGAERMARSAGATELLWPAWLGLGDVAERRGRFAEALDWDRRAASLIDTLRARQGTQGTSIVLLSRRLFAFEALIHLLGKLAPQFPDSGYDAEAFDWAERVRARAFLDLLNARGVAGQRITPVSLDAARAALPSDHSALLEYSLGDSSSSLWVVTRNSWLRLPLPPAPVLRPRVEMLRTALADPTAAESRAARSAARALYRQLIAPAEPALIGVDQLIVSPDGALSRIPFEALLAADAPADAPAPANAFLVERYAISYTPSATVFAAARAKPASAASSPAAPPRRAGRRAPSSPAAAPDVVAIGAPEFGPLPPRGAKRALAPLPHTLEELESLREIAGAARCLVVNGAAARRDTLLALAARPGAEVLHVATHGEANEAVPERSGLWLSASGDTTAPDFVSLDDLLALRMGTQLVTLSACETGAGRLERGEGVVGLARALMAAGAQSVVVSLWSVNDRSTAELMRAFYTPLLTGGASRTQALAEAKRALLRSSETRSPFHWAPFVLIGAPGRLDARKP